MCRGSRGIHWQRDGSLVHHGGVTGLRDRSARGVQHPLPRGAWRTPRLDHGHTASPAPDHRLASPSAALRPPDIGSAGSPAPPPAATSPDNPGSPPPPGWGRLISGSQTNFATGFTAAPAARSAHPCNFRSFRLSAIWLRPWLPRQPGRSASRSRRIFLSREELTEFRDICGASIDLASARISDFAERRYVSKSMVACKLYREGLIDHDQWGLRLVCVKGGGFSAG